MKQAKFRQIHSWGAPVALVCAALFVGCAVESTGEPGDGDGDTGDGDGDGDVSGTGGSTLGTGGATGLGTGGSAAGVGGTALGDTGGSVGDGDGDTGGSVGDGDGDGATLGSPACGFNLAGVEIKKDTACTAEDVQLCWRPCGPNNIGWKSETCNGVSYAEGACEFEPTGDYACYAIPSVQDASCPVATPQHNAACTVAACTTCSNAGNYLDSSGATKTGYCTCVDSLWKCASNTAWPCPAGAGCQ
jgi:hypothetical protein